MPGTHHEGYGGEFCYLISKAGAFLHAERYYLGLWVPVLQEVNIRSLDL